MNRFMKIAIEESKTGVELNEGGPFGAVIVKNNKIIAVGHNMVIQTNDPTAHAEITTIRKACMKLGRFDLSDCDIYSSCEPCPMCLSSIIWAKIKRVYYCNTAQDATGIGFDDAFIYDYLNGKNNMLKKIKITSEDAQKVFTIWKRKKNKVNY